MEAIDYLDGDFVTEAVELENIGRKADEARKTLEDFADDGAWPYELVRGEKKSARRPDGRISHSTSAMNLFAMGVACGRVQSSTLAPYVARLTGKKGVEARAKFDHELSCFLTAIAAEPVAADGKWHSYSQTYGDNDSFTLLWLLEMCRDLCGDVSSELRDMARKRYGDLVGFAANRITAVFKENAKPWSEAFEWPAGNGPSKHNEPLEHTFPTLHVVQLYDHLRAAKNAGDPALQSHGGSPPVLENLPRSDFLERYLHDRLHLQLSYSKIRDSSYDAAELAFTMEALLLLDEDAIDAATVAQCRRVLVDTQQANSYWRPLRPFFATPQGMVLLPLSVETANSLVRSFEIMARRERSRADRSGDAALFLRYTEWLFGRIIRGEDADGKRFVGWRSEHADDRGKIHTWETSQVLLYLLQYDSFLRGYRAERALRSMNLQVTEYPVTLPKRAELPRKTTPLQTWSEGKKAFVLREPVTGTRRYAVMAKMGEQFVKPRSGNSVSSRPSYSMLLYGPQGTGKTTFAKSLAECLGWRFISVSPSDFMVSGDSLVEARAKQLFDVLSAQTDAVILLDEIDRLILDRGSKAYGEQSDPFQLMTPGMLTKLQNLHDEGRSIFIISTNYAERIDPAIKRAGRIDEQYLVLPPDSAQRARSFGLLFDDNFPEKLRPVGADRDELVRDTVLWVFSELKNLVEAVAKSCRDDETRGNPWDRARVVSELKQLIVERPPAIRLVEYAGRFDDEKNTAGNVSLSQKPYEEALMLLYLVAESGRRVKNDDTLWRKITDVGRNGDRMLERVEVVKEHMSSPSVRRTLYATFDPDMARKDPDCAKTDVKG